MAGKNVRIGALRYDIIADSTLFSQGVSKAARMSKKLAKDIALTRTPLERMRREMMQANKALQAGLLDQKAYSHAQKRIMRQFHEENALVAKNTRAQLRNAKAKNANAAASRKMNLANIGGAAASFFGGRGGAAIGRGIGIGAMAGGTAGFGLAGLFAGSFAVTRMMEEFGKLEEATTDLKVFLGDAFGEKTAKQFRKIARETSLTTQGLIKNARVWASYGLETENIVEVVNRLGIAAGGEAEAFDNLTRAFAQVNAAGKLMGQEKNQLINAGFSLKIIADEAGISMENFSKAMEEGAISAEHVNDALFKATDKGGLYFGRLEKKAQTLNGQLDLVANNFNDLFANLGEQQSGLFGTILREINETLSEVNKVISKANELEQTRLKVKALEGRPEAPEGPIDNLMARFSSAYTQAMEGEDFRFPEEYRSFLRGPGKEGGFADLPTEHAEQMVDQILRTGRALRALASSTEENAARVQAQQQREDAELRRLEKDKVKVQEQNQALNLLATDDQPLTEAAKQAAGLPGKLGPGTIDEYNFIRDKMMQDRDLARRSLDELQKQTVELKKLTGEDGGNWRRKQFMQKHPRPSSMQQSLMPTPIPGVYDPAVPPPEPGMSAVQTVKERYRREHRELYDKWASMDQVDTEFGSYNRFLNDIEKRGYSNEAVELRAQYKKDLKAAKLQDAELNARIEQLGSQDVVGAIEEQTRALTKNEDKQLEGVD